MKIKHKWLLCFFCLLFSPTVFAVQTKALYETEVPVVSQEAKSRAEGLSTALQMVLVKASGNAHIADNPAIKAKLRSAEEWVNEYGYKQRTTENGDELILWAHFDPEGINSLLRDANVPVWGAERPLIVFWLTNELPGQQRHVVTEDQDVDFTGVFKTAASQHSLPVVFPLMDLTEMTEVSPESVVANDFPVLTAATKRYAGNALLVGRLMAVPQGVRLAATLKLNDETWQWDITERTPTGIAEALVDRMAGILSAHFAAQAAADAPATVQFTVQGINGAEDMTALTGYLQHLASVKDTDIVEVLGSSVVLELHLRGPVSAFDREISAGQRLQPHPGGETLTYDWKG